MQMQTLLLRRFCFVVAAASHSLLSFYHHRFLRFSLLFLMDFPSTFKFLTQASELGCGFVLLGYFSRLFNLLGFLLIFTFCLKFLRSDFVGSRSHLPPNPNPNKISNQIPVPSTPSNKNKASNSEDASDENLEDDMFDVMSLRKLVKIEKQRYHAACAEIEKERVAASSAAEEAMAMILRLQSEKSAVEIEANQFRRMVEERQEYDLEVIESLRWNVMQHEAQKSLLEDQLGVYREKLREYMSDEEIDQLEGVDASRGFLNFSVEYDLDEASLVTEPPRANSC